MTLSEITTIIGCLAIIIGVIIFMKWRKNK
jgi:hypothetical protein